MNAQVCDLSCDLQFSTDISTDVEEPCCERCRPRSPDICCDLCNPEWASRFHNSVSEAFSGDDSMNSDGEDPGEDIPKTRGSRKAKTDYIATGRDKRLWGLLLEWRQEAYEWIWGGVDPLNMGETLIIGNEMLQRIVDKAHWQDLKKPEEIIACTRWDDRFGLVDEILDIIKTTHRPTVLPLTTMTPRTTPSVRGVSAAPARHQRSSTIRCGQCQQIGHTCEYV